MKITGRLEKIEAALLEKKIPETERMKVVHDESEIPAIEDEYREKYGTTEGLKCVIMRIPEPEPLPDEQETEDAFTEK
jgi:hypothetical protein